MVEEWYCEIDERVFGPYNSRSLKHFAANGKLRPHHRVRKGRDGQWVPAENVHGLFDDSARQSNGGALELNNSRPSPAATSAQLQTPPPMLGIKSDRLKTGRRPMVLGAAAILTLVVAIGGSSLYFGPKSSDTTASGSSPSAATAVSSSKEALSRPKKRMTLDEFMALPASSAPPVNASPQEIDSLTPELLFAFASPAVVKISTKNEDGQVLGHGSGFVINSNDLRSPMEVAEGKDLASRWGVLSETPDKSFRVAYVCTNYHVIEAALEASIEFSDGTQGEMGEVLVLSAESDLAVLKAIVETATDPKGLALAEQVPKVGSAVCAIGSPLALDYSLSDGIISSVRPTTGGTTMLQTTTAISPGSSGGPLLSMDGKVVGITTSSRTGGQNLNFAVSSTTLRALLDGTYEKEPLSKGKSYLQLVRDAYLDYYFALAREERAENPLLTARKLNRKGEYAETVAVLKGNQESVPTTFRYLEQYALGEA